MKAEEFSSLSKEEQQKEIDKCSSFEYFYNNYCKKDNMPDFSQKVWEDYIEQIKKQRFSIRNLDSVFYPFTPEQCVE